MNPEEMDQKHQEGIKLANTDGMLQDGAEILMELGDLGHIDSIEQLVYIFLDLKESFIEIVDEKFIADEYLVVSWQTPYEFGDGSYFIFGLYRGETRSRIESVLQNEVFQMW